MIRMNIKIDDRQFRRFMKGFEKEIPFAISKALNQTGKDAVQYIRGQLPHIFTIRNTWEQRGVTFNPSNKRNLRIEIGSRHEYMKQQVEGGEKKAEAGKTLAVPVGEVKGQYYGRGRPRPTLKSMTRPSRWPGRYLRKQGYFMGRAGKGRRLGVWQRTRKGLRMMYHLVRSVKIRPRWKLHEQVEQIVSRNWSRNAIKAIEYAMKTSKK